MTDLPDDVARCIGIELGDGSIHAVCCDCRRRTDRSRFPLRVWVGPPMIDDKCDMRIAPGESND